MRFVSITLSDDQAELVAAALRDAEAALREELTNEETTNNEQMEEDSRAVGRLALLFQDASENPSKYPPAGAMAATVGKLVKRAKGPAQPQGRKNKRKERQERRVRTHKERRRLRKVIAESYNKARAEIEAEMAEADTHRQELEARLESVPRYDVMSTDGETILRDVPGAFIVRKDGGTPLDPLPEPAALELPAGVSRDG